MLRFLCAIWNHKDTDQSAAAELIIRRLCSRFGEFGVVLKVPGMSVLVTDENVGSACTLRDDSGIAAGVVIGSIFSRGSDTGPSPSASFSGRDTLSIVESEGKWIVNHCWGSYVAFLHNRDSGARFVLRAPVNAPPCLKLEYRGVHVFFSRLADWTGLGLLRLTVNWDYITAYSVFGRHWCKESAFDQIRELQGSECFKLRDSTASVSVYWDPCDIARSEPVESMKEATDQLGRVTTACVQSWAATHPHILHRLSGGLDSSIVLACLAQAGNKPSVICEHFYSHEPLGDERPYARLAAKHFDYPIVEKAGEQDIDMRNMRGITSSMIPCAGYAYLEITRYEVDLAKRHGATAIFSGDFGDLLFHVGPGLPAMSEYMRRHRLGRGLLQAALDAAILDGTSVWSVLRSGFHENLTRKRSIWSAYEQMKDEIRTRGVTTAAIEFYEGNAHRFVHPWLRNGSDVPTGKLWQIWLLPDDSDWHNPASQPGDPNIIRPLGGQPIVELCLRIPTYLNVRNGWDRAVARQAFAGLLPKELVLRTTKGCPEGRIRKLVAKNEQFIREILLDGELVQRRILDRSKLEAAMPGSPTASQAISSGVLEQLGTEVWLQHWASRSSFMPLEDDTDQKQANFA